MAKESSKTSQSLSNIGAFHLEIPMINGKKIKFPLIQINTDTYYLNYVKSFSKLYSTLDTWLIENQGIDEQDYREIFETYRNASLSHMQPSLQSPEYKSQQRKRRLVSHDGYKNSKSSREHSDRNKHWTGTQSQHEQAETITSPKFTHLMEKKDQEHKYLRQINPITTHTNGYRKEKTSIEQSDLDVTNFNKNLNDIPNNYTDFSRTWTENDKNKTLGNKFFIVNLFYRNYR